jgi:hypothetical protein
VVATVQKRSNFDLKFCAGLGLSMEVAVAFKRIPKSKWIALRTNFNNVFFYHIISKVASWQIPAELEEFMMNAFAPEDDDQIQEKLEHKQKAGKL